MKKKKLESINAFTYASQEIPSGYVCSKCGASGCKLWREYNTFLDHQQLHCATCAIEIYNKQHPKEQQLLVSEMDAAGMVPCRMVLNEKVEEFGRCDQLGWLVPAVPTEDGSTFWGYTSVPEDGCVWWRNLPSVNPCQSL